MSGDVYVNSVNARDASAAKVEVILENGQRFLAVASAKKHPNDPPVVSVGEALALSRALSKLAEDLERYAMDTNEMHIAYQSQALTQNLSF